MPTLQAQPTTSRNLYDKFIILLIGSTVLGTAQVSILSHLVIAGFLCLPFTLLEVRSIILHGKVKPIVLWGIAFLLYAILSVVWTSYRTQAFEGLWYLTWTICTFIGLTHAASKASDPVKSFVEGWLLLVLCTLPIALWELTTDSHIPGLGDYNANSQTIASDGKDTNLMFAAVTYKNYNSYCTLIAMATPLLFYGLCKYTNKLLYTIGIISTTLIVVINSSRGALLSLAIDIFIFFCYYKRLEIKRKAIVTWCLLIGFIIFVIQWGFAIASQAIFRIFLADKLNDTSNTGRFDVWGLSWDAFCDTYGLGTGAGSMQPVLKATGYWLNFCHNLVIEMLLQYGVIITLPFIWFVVQACMKLILNKGFERMLGLMCALSFIPTVIIDDSYLGHTYVWMWLAAVFALSRLTKKAH